MNPAPEPRWLSVGERRLFSVLQRASTPRAAVLICPPLWHEHARSHRLFALLAEALAEHGLTVLRFDYYGSGDSDGDDNEFTLHGACADSLAAYQALRAHAEHLPLAVLGVRGGALAAVPVAALGHAHALWLWQAQLDGADVLADLQARDAARRRGKEPSEPAAPPHSLMGFALQPHLLDELRTVRATPLADVPCPLLVLDAAGRSAALAPAQRIDLLPALYDWVEQPGMRRVPRPPLRDLAGRLAASLERT